MNPRPTVMAQGYFTLLFTVGAFLLVGDGPAVALSLISGAGLLLTIVWIGLYYVGRRRSGCQISQWRVHNDRVMLHNVSVGTLLPAVSAVAALLFPGWTGLFDHADGLVWQFTAFGLVLFFIPMVPSSAVDWYVIRPFRDGLNGDPTCQASHSLETRRYYAKVWVLHRMICEGLMYSGAALAIACATAGIVIATVDDTAVQAAIGALGLASAVFYPLKRIASLHDALEYVLRPTSGLGAWIAGKNADADPVHGFLMDISLRPGLQVFAAPQPPGSVLPSEDERYIPLSRRASISDIARPVSVCPGLACEFWIPGCDRGQQQEELKQTGMP